MGLEKEETKPKISSRKRIMKTQIEIYDIENSKNCKNTRWQKNRPDRVRT